MHFPCPPRCLSAAVRHPRTAWAKQAAWLSWYRLSIQLRLPLLWSYDLESPRANTTAWPEDIIQGFISLKGAWIGFFQTNVTFTLNILQQLSHAKLNNLISTYLEKKSDFLTLMRLLGILPQLQQGQDLIFSDRCQGFNLHSLFYLLYLACHNSKTLWSCTKILSKTRHIRKTQTTSYKQFQ